MQTLEVGYNKIAAQGAKALAPAVISLSNLTKIDMQYGQITRDGTKHICEIIRGSQSLQYLNIKIQSNLDLIQLATAIPSSKSLRLVHMRSSREDGEVNGKKVSVMDAFVRACRLSHSLASAGNPRILGQFHQPSAWCDVHLGDYLDMSSNNY
jgi:hypothetical protein